MYFFTCDEYVVFKDKACNVYTFSDSRVTWLSSEITLVMWSYYLNQNMSFDYVATSADMKDDGTGNCYPISNTPTQYVNGKVMNHTGGMCGFKYQITNSSKDWDNKFKVLKDGAATLLASSALAIAAVLAF